MSSFVDENGCGIMIPHFGLWTKEEYKQATTLVDVFGGGHVKVYKAVCQRVPSQHCL